MFPGEKKCFGLNVAYTNYMNYTAVSTNKPWTWRWVCIKYWYTVILASKCPVRSKPADS